MFRSIIFADGALNSLVIKEALTQLFNTDSLPAAVSSLPAVPFLVVPVAWYGE